MRTTTAERFPVEWVRDQFPAVRIGKSEDMPFAFMDNAGGAQIPDSALDEIRRFFHERNVYHAGAYRRAERTRDAFAAIRRRIAGFLGASSSGEVVFGLNATTLLAMFAEALRVTLESGDEIVVTCLEHEANVTPWLRLESGGAMIRFWNARAPEGTLEVEDLEALLSARTRLVAVTGASSILGTVTDIRSVATLAHDHGAILLVDGVHYVPHRRGLQVLRSAHGLRRMCRVAA
jgi:selenocysteine lyase/cysteine desulfurase